MTYPRHEVENVMKSNFYSEKHISFNENIVSSNLMDTFRQTRLTANYCGEQWH
jgi:hypothetical protein